MASSSFAAAPPSRNTLLNTANAIISGYNKWTMAAILAPRSPSCIHSILPSSLNRPARTNDEYAAYFEPILPAFRNWVLTVHYAVVDEVKRAVVMKVTSRANTDIGLYENEYMMLFWMTERGDQVERIEEWVDSAYSRNFLGKLWEHLAEKEEERSERERESGSTFRYA